MAADHVRLDMVNNVLRLLGLNDVTALTGDGASRGSQVAENQLEFAAQELQDRAWYFNLDLDVKLDPTSRNFTHLPNGSSLPDEERRNKPYIIERSDRRLYDSRSAKKTFELGTAPVNLVVDPFDMGGAAWTPSDMTVAVDDSNVGPPGGIGIRNTDTLTDDGLTPIALITQTILAAQFTDGKTYVVGVYARDGAVATSSSASLRFEQNVGNRKALINFDPKNQKLNDLTFEAVTGEVVALDDGWSYAFFEVVWDTAFGDVDLMYAPNSSTAVIGATNVGGISIIEKGLTTTKVNLARCFDFQDLLAEARRFVIRKAATEANDILTGTTARRRHLEERKNQAFGDLQRADGAQGTRSMLVASHSVARVTGNRRRIPVLRNFGSPGTFRT